MELFYDALSDITVDPIELFQADLDTLEDPMEQIEVIEKLNAILEIADQTKVTENLLPHLIKFIQNATYEVMDVLSVQLSQVLEKLVKSEENQKLLMSLVQNLLILDATNIKAVDLGTQLIPLLSEQVFRETFLDVFNELYNYGYPIFYSAIDLLSVALSRIDDDDMKNEIRLKLEKYLDNDSDLIRNILAQKFECYVELFNDNQENLKTAGTFVKNFCTDRSTTVRFSSVSALISISKRLTEEQIDEHVSPLFENLSTDEFWKVRYEFTCKLREIQDCLGPRLSRILLLPIIQNLGKDPECLVRESLADIILQVLQNFKETCNINLETFWNIIDSLNQDTANEVRIHMAETLLNATEILSVDECHTFLLPFIMNAIKKDLIPEKDILIENINKFLKKLGYKPLEDELQVLIFGLLSNNRTKWRTKRAILNTILVMSQLTEKGAFTENILPFYEKLLLDKVFGVRRIASAILPILIARFGFEWAEKTLFKRIFTLYAKVPESKYLLTIHCIEEILNSGLYNINNPFKSYSWHDKTRENLYTAKKLNEILGNSLNDYKAQQSDENDFPLKILEGNIPTSNAELKFYMENTYSDFIDFNCPELNLIDILYFIIELVIPTMEKLKDFNKKFIVERLQETWKLLKVFHENISNTYGPDKNLQEIEDVDDEDKKHFDEIIDETLSKTTLEQVEDDSLQSPQMKHRIISDDTITNETIFDNNKTQKHLDNLISCNVPSSTLTIFGSGTDV